MFRTASGMTSPSPVTRHSKGRRKAWRTIIGAFTGIALAGGILILTYWLTAATYGADAFATALFKTQTFFA